MIKWTYEVEKHTTVEYFVMARKNDEPIKTPVAKCNSQGIAYTIKGLYEKYDSENPKG